MKASLFFSGFGVKKMVLTIVLIPLTVFCNDPGLNKCAFEKLAELNPSAAAPWEAYRANNRRELKDYNKLLMPPTGNIKNLVPENGVAIDLGGGRGLAFWQMAYSKNIRAIVINTQENPQYEPEPQMQGKFEYIRGWAEEKLPNYKDQADLITDVWGAFSYSPKKKEIIESVWRSLKPGGNAYIFYPTNRSKAFVDTKDGDRVQFYRWIQTIYPDYFKTYETNGDISNITYGRFTGRKIIERDGFVMWIHKPRGETSPDSLKLPIMSVHESTRLTNGLYLPQTQYIEK